MNKEIAVLRSWETREEDLRQVNRYRRFDVMLYRTNLHIHSMRVPRIVERLLPAALRYYPELDAEKALLISKFHDDHEMVHPEGDIPLQWKMAMSSGQLFDLKEEELFCAKLLSKAYRNPRIQGYAYRDLVLHAIKKDCPEAQLHSFADKLDGYSEALHEVLAGNVSFLEAVVNYLVRSFSDLPKEFPLIRKVFGNGLFYFPLFALGGYLNGGAIGHPHTAESIAQKTDLPHYEMWKEVTLELPNGMALLTEQKEQRLSLPQPAEMPAPKLAIAKKSAKGATRSIA